MSNMQSGEKVKKYPGKCFECQGKTFPVIEDYQTFQRDNDTTFHFIVKDTPLIKCESCGEIYVNNDTSTTITNAFAALREAKGITILCGFPGCGKSTYLLSNYRDHTIISPDDFRLALTGKEYFAPAEDSVWSHVKIATRVLAGMRKQSVIIDATHLTQGSRGQWVRLAKDIDVAINCLWLDVPFDVCMERNLSRKRVVPEDVMNRMRETFEEPMPSEGFMVIQPKLSV